MVEEEKNRWAQKSDFGPVSPKGESDPAGGGFLGPSVLSLNP